ncbi:small integral membrane protein 35 isoform X1 [Columba livia]|uniref:small integral membrane protein 35 isoform X1 n=1 Tax=Columba livia TaxID=8932 RepID=UPI0031BA36BC
MDHGTGQEPIKGLGLVLGVGLALLILVLLSYTIVRWYRRGQCWRRPNFVFNLYHNRCLGLAATPSLETEEDAAALSQPSSSTDPGGKSCLSHVSPWLSDSPALGTSQLHVQETLGRLLGNRACREPAKKRGNEPEHGMAGFVQ